MKTLTNMKKVFRFNRFLLSSIILCSLAALSSCGNDDNSKIPFFSLKDVEGTYSGKMTTVVLQPIKSTGESTPNGVDVLAEVKDENIIINKFPINDLITSIAGEENAPAIIEALGEINYKTEYKATFNAKRDSIYMQLEPKPLELKLTLPTETEGEEPQETIIKVTITSEKGNFAYESKKLKFSLIATEVTVNEQPFNFTTTTFSFNLNKK